MIIDCDGFRSHPGASEGVRDTTAQGDQPQQFGNITNNAEASMREEV